LGSIRKVVINLEETIKKTKFTPPSPMKATPNTVASNTNDMCQTSVSNTDDVTVTSSNQKEGVNIDYSTPMNKDPPEGKTSADIAVMRGKPKDGYHCHCSNKHYRQTLVWVLLDSGSDGDLVFASKVKPMLLPYSKKLVPQLWNTSNGQGGAELQGQTQIASLLEKTGSTVMEYFKWDLLD
jgi:hypothetical protein